MSAVDIGTPLTAVPAPAGGAGRRGQLSRRFSLLLIAPLVLLLGWTFFLPIARLLLTSFAEPSLGLSNYARLWSEPLYLQVFVRTLWIAAACTLFTLVIGYPVALLMARHGGRFALIATMCVLIPLWTSVLVRSYAWVIVLERNGLINGWLMAGGLITQPLKLLYTNGAVLVAMTHVLLPFMVLPLYGVMKGINPTTMRAALSLGARPHVAFRRVYLPQTMPGISAGCLLVFILALGYYITPALVGGADDQMVSYFIAFYTNETLNWGMAAALAVILLTVTLVLYVCYNRLSGSAGPRRG